MPLNIDNLHFPDYNEARHIDWSQLFVDHDDAPNDVTYEYTEASKLETAHGYVTVVWRNGDVYAFQPAGSKLIEWGLAEDWTEDFESDPDAADAETGEILGRRQDIVDTIQAAENDGAAVNGIEGPMMSDVYPVMSDVHPDTSAEWAAHIVDLPLCVVELDGYTGLALTGGGMDLSWEIAEAFVRIGFYPPLGPCSDLPAMADKRYPVDGDDKAVVSAVIDHLNRRAANMLASADRLRDRYLSVNV